MVALPYVNAEIMSFSHSGCDPNSIKRLFIMTRSHNMHIFGESPSSSHETTHKQQLNGETYLLGVDLLSLVQCYEDCWHDSGFFFFFFSSKTKKSQAPEAAQALKPPGLKGLKAEPKKAAAICHNVRVGNTIRTPTHQEFKQKEVRSASGTCITDFISPDVHTHAV